MQARWALVTGLVAAAGAWSLAQSSARDVRLTVREGTSMAAALSPDGTVLGAVFTFVLYGVLPLSIVLYVMASPMRRRARQRALARQQAASAADPDGRGEPAGDAVAPVGKEP